jgi:hypothetical protein
MVLLKAKSSWLLVANLVRQLAEMFKQIPQRDLRYQKQHVNQYTPARAKARKLKIE